MRLQDPVRVPQGGYEKSSLSSAAVALPRGRARPPEGSTTMFQQHQPTIKNEVLTSGRDLTGDSGRYCNRCQSAASEKGIITDCRHGASSYLFRNIQCSKACIWDRRIWTFSASRYFSLTARHGEHQFNVINYPFIWSAIWKFLLDAIRPRLTASPSDIPSPSVSALYGSVP